MGIRVTTLDAEVEQQRKVMTAAEVEQPVDLNPRMSEQEAASTEPEEEIVEFIPAKSESVASTDPTYDPLLSELASMSRIEYDRRREDAAKQMEIRVATLDAEIELRRKTMALGTMEPKFLADIDPWEVAVDGSDLLDEIANALLKYVVLPDGALEAIVLWIVHAHAHDAAQVSPILAITSPEKRCGKTTLLSAIYNVCPRALPTSNITVASLFRVVEAYRPTVLIDEADTFLSDNDALRGVLNSGHNRSQAYVLRTVGDDHEPKQFATWSPKAIALIGRLRDTLADRAIAVALRRKLPNESVTRFRSDRVDDLVELQRKAARFAADNLEALRESDACVPLELHDRAADNWRPLLAIADRAGGEWPTRARQAAKLLSLGDGTDEDSARVMLLADIKAIFEQIFSERIPTKSLVTALVELEDRPWAEWRHGKSLTGNSLAKLLRPLDIRPKAERVDGKVVKGYAKEQFSDAWNRYLPDQSPTERLHGYKPQNSADNGDVQTVTPDPDVTDERPPKPAESFTCNRVTDELPELDDDGDWAVEL